MKSLYLLSLGLCISVVGCDKEDRLAKRIERDTPTELPPITSVGANTMGAYVTIGDEQHLFVASGVERGGSVGSISADCEAFNNYLYRSDGNIVIQGIWCSRPEISLPKRMSLAILFPTRGDSLGMAFGIDYDGLSGNPHERYGSYGIDADVEINVNSLDTINHIAAGIFSGYVLNFDNPLDTAFITDGRFDVYYGITP